MAKFNDDAKQLIAELHAQRREAAEIVRRLRLEHGVDSKSVRKHLAGLDVLKDLGVRGVEIPDQLDARNWFQSLFDTYGGSSQYLRKMESQQSVVPRHMPAMTEDDAAGLRREIAFLREESLRPVLRRHWRALFDKVLALHELQPFSFANFDLVLFSREPTETWPISQGQMALNRRGKAVATFFVESEEAWERTKEHLPGDAIWEQIEQARRALEIEMDARLAFYRAVRSRVEMELLLSIIPTLSTTVADSVSEHYVFALHVAGLSHALGRDDWRRSREDFLDGRAEWMAAPVPGTPREVSLGSVPVIAASETLATQAIDYFLEVQEELHSSPEAISATVAYRNAEHETDLVRTSLERIRALPEVPGRCRDCPGQTPLSEGGT